MREIITISFGCHSNQIIKHYHNKLILDHNLTNQQNQSDDMILQKQSGISASFECFQNQQIFRSLSLGDEKSINKILLDDNSNFLNPNYQIETNQYNNSTFHCGQRIFHSSLIDNFEEKLLLLLEKCDSPSYINLIHSASDKFSGFLPKILQNSKIDNLFHQTNSIFPNINTCSPIEIYNTSFSLNELIENAVQSFIFDYEALSYQLNQIYCKDNLQNIFDVIAENILQSNCSMRFPGYLNGDYRKIAVNLISFPRMHFLNSSFSKLNESECIKQSIFKLSQPKNSSFSFIRNAKNFYRTQCFISRTINNYMQIQIDTTELFNQTFWIKNGFLNINCKIPHYDLGDTIMHIGIHNYFGWFCKQLSQNFLQQWKKRSYFHHFSQEGADELEFIYAEQNITDLYCEYYTYECIDNDE